MRQFFIDSSISAWIAGFIATIISFSGPLVVIVQAADSAQLSAAELSSWLGAVAIGSGVLGLILSFKYKAPIVIAWSIPGSALLVSLLPEVGLSQAVGAYLVAGVLVAIIGWSGVFDTLIARLPESIAAGLQAGILLKFGTEVFRQLTGAPLLITTMFMSYILMRRFLPRYSVASVLVVGLVVVIAQGNMNVEALEWGLVTPVLTVPTFNALTTISLAIPLAIVALAGQFMPGISILRNSGYQTPASPLISSSGIMSIIMAPFGGHGFNLAAVTLALCTSPEAHLDPKRRYVAAVAGSVFYLVFGIAGATLVSLFVALPSTLIAALAGLALCGALGEGLRRTMSDSHDREAGLFCFIVTASGMQLFGLSAPFWGVVAGLFVHAVISGKFGSK